MNPHEAERHEERLPELLAGSDDPRRSFEESDLSGCPTCRDLFDELLGLRTTLDELGRDQREALASGASAEEGTAEDRVETLLRSHMAETGTRPAPPASSPRRWPVLILAAALVLFAITVILTSLPDTVPPYDPGTTLGEKVELVHPLGEVESYPPFRWTGDLPEGGHFRIEIHDAEDPTPPPFLESPPWHETTWHPDPGARAWPRRIRWIVTTVDAASESRDTVQGWASLPR